MGNKSSQAPQAAPAGASLVGSVTPWGSSTYNQTGTVHVKNGPDQPMYTNTITLSPQQQQLLTRQQDVYHQLANQALTDSKHIGGQDVQDALYRRSTAMLDPQYEQLQAHNDAQLAAQGITAGSHAYQQSQDNFARQRDAAYAGARDNAITGGGAEESRQINQILAELGQGQVQNPGYNSAGMGAATAASQAQNASAMAGWQAQQANQQATMGGLFGLGGALGTAGIFKWSDIRLKDILKPAGKLGPFDLWLYRFKGDESIQLGVIAQEVREIAPDLVFEHENGMLAVDYGGLIDRAAA